MKYSVQHIHDITEIYSTPVCSISNFNWGGEYRPKSFGQMALLNEKELLVHMWCEEQHPVTLYHNHQDPVYKDSALEFFMSPANSSVYYNFEINSVGALLAHYGPVRANRASLTTEQMEQIGISCSHDDTAWHVLLSFPIELLSLDTQSSFRFNMYKIKESPGNMHFASYAPISSPKPDFHLPEFFAEACF